MILKTSGLLIGFVVLIININCHQSGGIGNRMTNSTEITRDLTLKTGGRYHLPLATGPYPNVGHIDILTGTDRNDGVLVRLLYPASNQSVDPKVNCKLWPNWHPTDQYRRGYFDAVNITSTLMITLSNVCSTNVYIPTVENVDPLRLKNQTSPVIIFSHGLSSCRTTYSNICYELASYGFFVFAVEHRDGSACTTFYPNKDGSEPFKWIPYKHKNEFTDEFEGRNQQLDLRVAEIEKVINIMTDLQNGRQVMNVLKPQMNGQKFAGLFDVNKVIAMGHSFGAATVIRAIKSMECVKLGICIDAWMFALSNLDTSLVKKPMLFINMETFQWIVNLKTMRTFISKDGRNTDKRKVLTIKEAQHTDPSDFPFILNNFVKRLVKLNSKMDPFVVHDLTTALTLQFIKDILQIKLKDKRKFIEKHRSHLKEGLENIE